MAGVGLQGLAQFGAAIRAAFRRVARDVSRPFKAIQIRPFVVTTKPYRYCPWDLGAEVNLTCAPGSADPRRVLV
jgi:hypothetical protein